MSGARTPSGKRPAKTSGAISSIQDAVAFPSEGRQPQPDRRLPVVRQQRPDQHLLWFGERGDPLG
jgi:hypothetical protein